MWSATQIPHILRFALAATTGVPESKIRVIAPDVGGGFGGKLQVTPEEWIAWWVARQLQQAGQVHRDPLGVADGRPPRSRPVAEAHPGRREGRQRHRPQGRAAGRPRLLRRDRRRRRAGARRVHVQRHLQVPGVPLRLPDGADQQDLDRRLPRRRPSRGDLRHRADHGRARRRAGGGPPRDPREELDQARGVPLHHGRRPGVRLRQLRGGHRQGHGAASGTTSCGPSRSGAATRATRSSSASASRPSPRCAASRRAGCWASSTTAQAAGSTQGCGCSRPARVEITTGASAHGQGHETAFSQIVADRLGVPFETSRSCTATPRSPTAAWTPTAPARWSSVARRSSRPSTR